MGNDSVVDLHNLEHDRPALAKKVLLVSSDGNVIEPRNPLSIVIDPVADANPQTFEDTSFVLGDSPAILDCNAALGRNATQFTLINDGAGSFTVATSNDGISFGDENTVKNGEIYSLENLSIDSIRITHVTDSSYRVVVI